MNSPVLERLQSVDFSVAVGFHSNPAVLRRGLARMPEIAAVRAALTQGAITEEGIRRFVSCLMEGFTRGKHFAHDDALAALCVALETRPTDFAEEFLHDLGRLELAELGMCIRVARECLKRRVTVARRRHKVLDLRAAPEQVALPVVVWQPTLGENGFDNTKTDDELVCTR